MRRALSFDPIIVLIWICIAGCIVGAVMSTISTTEYRQACEKLGGIPLQGKHSRVCLNPKAVL